MREVENGESSQLNEARLFLQKERVRDFGKFCGQNVSFYILFSWERKAGGEFYLFYGWSSVRLSDSVDDQVRVSCVYCTFPILAPPHMKLVLNLVCDGNNNKFKSQSSLSFFLTGLQFEEIWIIDWLMRKWLTSVGPCSQLQPSCG